MGLLFTVLGASWGYAAKTILQCCHKLDLFHSKPYTLSPVSLQIMKLRIWPGSMLPGSELVQWAHLYPSFFGSGVYIGNRLPLAPWDS
jgi:hypothetical protein